MEFISCGDIFCLEAIGSSSQLSGNLVSLFDWSCLEMPTGGIFSPLNMLRCRAVTVAGTPPPRGQGNRSTGLALCPGVVPGIRQGWRKQVPKEPVVPETFYFDGKFCLKFNAFFYKY